MTPIKPHVRASVLSGFDKFLLARKVSIDALFSGAGLPLPLDVDGEANLPIDNVVQLMENAAAEAGDPCIGLSWAESYPVGGMGVLAYLFMNATTVGDGLKTLARYAVLLRQPFTVHYEEANDGAMLWWRWPECMIRPYKQYNSFAMALLVTRLRMATGPDWIPEAVELQCEPLQCRQKVQRIFGSNITFLSDRNAVCVSAATISKPMPYADPMLRPVLKQLGEKLISELPSVTSTMSNVRNAILDLLPESRAGLEDVASRLQMSARQLQNRLAQEDTTFEQVLSDTLKARAAALLQSSDLSLTEISMLLGFSELSAFTRAAQRWFGMAPSAYRQYAKSTKP